MYEDTFRKIADMIVMLDDRLRQVEGFQYELRTVVQQLQHVEDFQGKLKTAVRQLQTTAGSSMRLGTKLETRMDQEILALRNVINDVHVMLDPVVDRVMPADQSVNGQFEALLARRRPPDTKDA